MDRTARHRNQLPSNLPQLQNLIKRESSLYKEEFLQQYDHYRSLVQLFLINPSQHSEKLQELIMFLSQICCCYPDNLAEFPSELQELLRKHASILDSDVRLTLCRGLILMRNKNFVQAQSLLELFFQMFRCQDKVLRMTLYNHIVSDIKRLNAKHKNNKVNKGLQTFMYTMLSDSSSVAARMSLDVMVEMYKKNIWNDARTVNVMSTACFSSVSRIVSTALKFFLSGDEEGYSDAESSDSEDESSTSAMRSMIISKQVTKRGKKQRRKMEKALATIKKHQKKRKGPKQTSFSALHLLNDPQDFVEKLFKSLEKSREKFTIRLMMMSLISRLIGLHQLFLFNYYPFIQRYIQPHQREVTKILTFFAQACHELIPPDIIQPTLRAVVHNFVSERNSSEVMVVGLNTIREVCVRCPLVMEEDLLRDLTAYKSYKNKGVMMAARSLIQLFRTIKPEMLHRKDRGKPTEVEATCKDYGQVEAARMVPGSELLDLESDEASVEESESEDNDSSDGEWIDINHHDNSGDDIGNSEKDTHELEIESENESDEWLELESESEVESESDAENDTPQFTEDRTGQVGSMEIQGLQADQQNDSPTDQISANHPKKRKRDEEASADVGEPLRTVKKVRFEGLEEGMSKEALAGVKEKRKKRAADITQSRLLTQEEFKLIRQKQLSAQVAPRRGVKQQLADLLTEQEQRRVGVGELLPEAAISSLDHVKRKADKRARIESVKSGREGREKFGSKKQKLNPHSSTTNKQKAKKKAFMMQKQKRNVRTKSKKSFREKQMALRKSLLKQKYRK